MSVAAIKKKGKSRMKKTRRPLRQGLGVLVALEVPQQQYEEENDCEHQNAEVVPGCIGAAHR